MKLHKAVLRYHADRRGEVHRPKIGRKGSDYRRVINGVHVTKRRPRQKAHRPAASEVFPPLTRRNVEVLVAAQARRLQKTAVMGSSTRKMVEKLIELRLLGRHAPHPITGFGRRALRELVQ